MLELQHTADRTKSKTTVAIVGGGLLGMTLALRLARGGRSVTLIEAAPELGGLAAPWEIGEVTWDRYYHVMLESDTALRGLLEELGLDRDIHWTTTRTAFATNCYRGARGERRAREALLHLLRLELRAARLDALPLDASALRRLRFARFVLR